MYLPRLKAILSVTTLILLGSLPVFAQSDCKRHVEATGGFSMCVPEGWEIKEKEGEKYKIFMATSSETFNPNINFKNEVHTLTLNDYATAAVDYILKNYQTMGATSVTVVSRESFTTETGIVGVRLIFRTEFKGLFVRTLQYYFDAGENNKLIVTGTALEKDKVNLDPLFDRAVRTFRIIK